MAYETPIEQVAGVVYEAGKPGERFGIVTVIRGRHRGLVVYYDDDANDGATMLICYPDCPALVGPYIVIRRTSAREPTTAEVAHYHEILARRRRRHSNNTSN
jgi:hypothetical protein